MEENWREIGSPQFIYETAIKLWGVKEFSVSAEQYMAWSGRRNPQAVLIISYETFRLHASILHRGTVGLVICDEVIFSIIVIVRD